MIEFYVPVLVSIAGRDEDAFRQKKQSERITKMNFTLPPVLVAGRDENGIRRKEAGRTDQENEENAPPQRHGCPASTARLYSYI